MRSSGCVPASSGFCVCFHSTSVGVDHVSKRFTGGLQGSSSTERWRKGRQGSSTSEALMALNWAIPASERTLQRPPYHTARSTISPCFSAVSLPQPLHPLSHSYLSSPPPTPAITSFSLATHLFHPRLHSRSFIIARLVAEVRFYVPRPARCDSFLDFMRLTSVNSEGSWIQTLHLRIKEEEIDHRERHISCHLNCILTAYNFTLVAADRTVDFPHLSPCQGGIGANINPSLSRKLSFQLYQCLLPEQVN